MKLFSKVNSIVLITGIFLMASSSLAADKLVERKGHVPAGEVIFAAGRAMVRLVPEEQFRTAVPRQELVSGDIVKTGAGGRLSILFRDDTQLKLASNTTIIIKDVTPHREKAGAFKILLKLESGEVWTRSKGLPDGLMVETPYATAAIRGTEWSLSVGENASRVIVMEGHIQMTNQFGSVTVGSNEEAVVMGGQAPVKSIIIRPRDRIQWTYYLTERKLLGYLKFKDATPGGTESLFNEGRLEESARAFQEIISKEPENASALSGLGLIAIKRGENEKAEEYLSQSLRIKKSLLPHLGMVYLFLSENMIDEAMENLRDAKALFPKEPLPYIFSSYLSTLLGDFQEALVECDRGLSTMTNNPLLLSFKADLYFILDKPEEAKVAIDILLREHPESSEGHERLGFYYRVITGDSEKALEMLQKAISLDRLNDEAIAKLADLLREQGYIAEAEKLIEAALSLAPWNAMHHYNRGRLLADINRIAEARVEFRKALELDPTFSRAYLGEGIVLLKEGRTDVALREISKASLFEPNLSEIHAFLAIAYYQKHNVSAAIDELKRAEECDPLDSTPHQLASVIYNDLYMPVNAIEEAKKVLELLPYRKASGEALLESAKSGTMSVNYGLDFLDLPEWSLYYAQKALFINPYDNTSHLGVAIAYSKLGAVSALQGYNEFSNPVLSELLQGLTLNVNSLNFSNRYSTLISKPGHYLTFGGIYGQGDSEEKQIYTQASGDFGSRFPLTYGLSAGAYKDNGYLENSEMKNMNTEIIIGYKPRYDHDIYLDFSYTKKKLGVTPEASEWLSLPDIESPWAPDNNQEYRASNYYAQIGYHWRLSPISHLIMGLRYLKNNDNRENPDPGSDLSGFEYARGKVHNTAVGLRHMLTILDNHQVSYGVDYNYLTLRGEDEWPLYPPDWIQQSQTVITRRSGIFHVYDRWFINKHITMDMGLFLSYYSPETAYEYNDTLLGSSRAEIDKNEFNINPKLGFALDLGKRGVLRIAYQRRSTPAFHGELAPVGTSGLIPPTFDIFFNEAEDVQGSLEYELTKKTFVKASLGYESLNDLTTTWGDKSAQLWYSRVSVNQILSQYFSFSARYHYNDSRYLDGSGRNLFGIPRHSGDARLVFIHPLQIYLWLREYYIGERYADSENANQLSDFFLTDFYAQKEFFKKKVLLSLTVTNIFNKKYEMIGHSYYWYEGALPAKGTTVYVRMEYRI
jgi:tetratricopeptide (TPR) repeat protein